MYQFCKLSVPKITAEQGRQENMFLAEGNSRPPEFNRTVLRTSLLADGRSTPAWVKARFRLITRGRLQSRASYGPREWSQDNAQGQSLPKANTSLANARDLRHVLRGGDGGGNGRMHSVGTTSEALATLKNRLQRGITVDSNMYVDVLQKCLKQKDLLAAKQVHDCIIESGMDKNQSVANVLLNVYVKCGRLLDARRLFDQFKNKDVVTWNTMIAGYANKKDHAKSALEFFNRMRQEGLRPTEVTYVCILKACASQSALKWGKEVHDSVAQAGFETDMRVGTALLQMYAKCECITEASRVFENLTNRNIYAWNIMIGAYAKCGRGMEAYQLFRRMRTEGFEPNEVTFINILNAPASAEALEWVKEVHAQTSKAGLESDLRVGSALILMYAKCGKIDEARLVFNKMETRDIVTWNIMIGGLAEHECGHEAYHLLLQMKREGFKPNAITYISILNASASAGALEWVKEVHAHARKEGLDSDLRVGSALVHMYAKCGSMDDGQLAFDRMQKRDVVMWNTMIGAYAESGRFVEAHRLFLQMKREGFEPDAITYISILNASARAGPLEWVKEVHAHASKAKLDSDLKVGSALVRMYAKSGSLNDARLVFGRMEKRDVSTWTIMIGALAEHGFGHEAVALIQNMNADHVKPNGTSFLAVLSACVHAGLLDDGRRLFSAMTQDYGIEPDIMHYNCMVDLLGRAGKLEEAKLFVRKMPVEPNAVTWGIFLGACRTYGNVELGELAANEFLKLEPNVASAYVLLSNIYAAAGKWDKVSIVRTMMQKRGVRKEPGRSWIEVDNKIHEFVVGDTSHPEAKAIYSFNNKLTEKLKAEGYIPDTQHVLQNINEEDKELVLCSHSERLAIAYGLMRIPRGKIRVFKNLRVCSDCHAATKFISKVTGREIVARDANRFHHFKNGECSCGDYW
ncbi:unnamed protein product [Calypogeia fissa]